MSRITDMRGSRADEIAREIKAQGGSDEAVNRAFGRPGQREGVPQSLRKAVFARLHGEREFITAERIPLDAGENTSLRGVFQGAGLYRDHEYFHRAGRLPYDNEHDAERLKFISFERTPDGLQFHFKRPGGETLTIDDSNRVFFKEAPPKPAPVEHFSSRRNWSWGGSW